MKTITNDIFDYIFNTKQIIPKNNNDMKEI